MYHIINCPADDTETCSIPNYMHGFDLEIIHRIKDTHFYLQQIKRVLCDGETLLIHGPILNSIFVQNNF